MVENINNIQLEQQKNTIKFRKFAKPMQFLLAYWFFTSQICIDIQSGHENWCGLSNLQDIQKAEIGGYHGKNIDFWQQFQFWKMQKTIQICCQTVISKKAFQSKSFQGKTPATKKLQENSKFLPYRHELLIRKIHAYRIPFRNRMTIQWLYKKPQELSISTQTADLRSPLVVGTNYFRQK